MTSVETNRSDSPSGHKSRGMVVRTASSEDLPEVLRVQRAAFRRVALSFGVPETRLQPMTETLANLEQLLSGGVRTFVAVVPDGGRERVVGTVGATTRDDGIIEIGRLAVDDGFTRRGVATALMAALEGAFPATDRFELFTGADAVEPLALYARLGYRIFRREQFESWSMVWLGKERDGATATGSAPVD